MMVTGNALSADLQSCNLVFFWYLFFCYLPGDLIDVDDEKTRGCIMKLTIFFLKKKKGLSSVSNI